MFGVPAVEVPACSGFFPDIDGDDDDAAADDDRAARESVDDMVTA